MKRFFRIAVHLLGLAVLLLGLFIATMWAREWNPAPVESLDSYDIYGEKLLPADTIYRDTIKIVSWNIGYAGLGDDMDFFYDGGKQVRTSRERTEENLQAILAFLKQHEDADFILLQEVDFDSRRSYRINQYDSIRRALPRFFGWQTLNYSVDFVPLPLRSPMGRVRSGLVLLSRWAPLEISRLQYPGNFGFPVRLFNLKRGMLSASFLLGDSTGMNAGGPLLYINNTHNSAYDTGGMRQDEIAFIRRYLEGKPRSVTMGDWNSTPPGYTASEAAMTDRHFRPVAVNPVQFPADMSFVYDPTVPTVRYGYEPYDPATTTTTLIDFALCGSGIRPVGIETIDLRFRNSDHNPVIGRFVILRPGSGE